MNPVTIPPDAMPSHESRALPADGDCDRIVVESTRIGEPLPIACAFRDASLEGRVHLANLVAVNDVGRYWADHGREDEIEDSQGNPVLAPLAPLPVEPVDGVSVILLNRPDLAGEAAPGEPEGYPRNSNPEAAIRRTVRGDVDIAWLLCTDRYADTHMGDGPGRGTDANGAGMSEADEYGFTSIVYTLSRPFVWGRLVAALGE